ncbi:MAG: hypothetical protein SGJ09_01480 [Phycisphaerae bacterium]|nr:hypothetical protein [Phycisphaerae bacterium]
MRPEFGPGYDPETPARRARLSGLAANAEPLITVITGFAARNRNVPQSLSDLASELSAVEGDRYLAAAGTSPPAIWNYAPDGEDACLAWCKLSFDASLNFHYVIGRGASWTFELGDGSPSVALPSLSPIAPLYSASSVPSR